MMFYPLVGSLFALAIRLIGRLVHRSRVQRHPRTNAVESISVDAIASALRCDKLLPRHGDAYGFLRRHEVIDACSILGDGELDALDATRKLIPARPVVR
jgi:hypothetical protein